MCVVQASEHNLVHAERAQLLVQARPVESTIRALGRDQLPLTRLRLQLGDHPRSALPAIVCSPPNFSSASPPWCASLGNTTTQPSRRACPRSRFNDGTITPARALASAPSTKSSSMSISPKPSPTTSRPAKPQGLNPPRSPQLMLTRGGRPTGARGHRQSVSRFRLSRDDASGNLRRKTSRAKIGMDHTSLLLSPQLLSARALGVACGCCSGRRRRAGHAQAACGC
jgi:hypothetical protein